MRVFNYYTGSGTGLRLIFGPASGNPDIAAPLLLLLLSVKPCAASLLLTFSQLYLESGVPGTRVGEISF